MTSSKKWHGVLSNACARGLALLLVACGTTLPPKELVDARNAYARASKGRAAALAPAQLDTAKQSLAAAEQSFEDEGDEPVTVDLAYVAQRRAELAEATAEKEAADRARDRSEQELKDLQAHGFEKTQDQLAAERHKAERTKAEAERTKAELEVERKRRAEVEKKLADIAKVKAEPRGMVITLSGSVLFETGKFELRNHALNKLDEVAKALSKQGFGAILVEGHTDSRGNPTGNEVLSLQRAEAVRTHLVNRGIPSDKIRAVGLASGKPVASNATAEGRADNRRVELIVEPAK